MEMSYQELTTGELVAYYKRVKQYIEQGFRVEGLKDELVLISDSLKEKSTEICDEELEQYLSEIELYLNSLRH